MIILFRPYLGRPTLFIVDWMRLETIRVLKAQMSSRLHLLQPAGKLLCSDGTSPLYQPDIASRTRRRASFPVRGPNFNGTGCLIWPERKAKKFAVLTTSCSCVVSHFKSSWAVFGCSTARWLLAVTCIHLSLHFSFFFKSVFIKTVLFQVDHPQQFAEVFVLIAM